MACDNSSSSEKTQPPPRLNPPITTNDSFPIGKIIPAVACQDDASFSYALYIPQKKEDPAPLIYFFDPHADGPLPLNKYRALADKYGFILVGSNNSKNGNDYQKADLIWHHIFTDTKKRLPVDFQNLVVCGFSGGAKVAGFLALNHPEIKSVIANSAAMPENASTADFPFSFTGLAGEGDMNMTDVVTFCQLLDKTKTLHRMILFDGKHEWAPQSDMRIAFLSVLLDRVRQNNKPGLLISEYISLSKKRLTEFLDSHQWMQADNESIRSLQILKDIPSADTAWFTQKHREISNSESFKKEEKSYLELFSQEQSFKSIYQQQFQKGDLQYWQQTIGDLREKSKSHSMEGAMYNRLLAFLSLAFYSISNQLINSNQNPGAEYYSGLYKLADPSNSEAWYFSAILNARNNNSDATESDLLKAVETGFRDSNRMMQQPEFLSLHIDFNKIENRMHNP
jgi:hypothetical protein